jgi:uncharacterized protein (DUF1330 family)
LRDDCSSLFKRGKLENFNGATLWDRNVGDLARYVAMTDVGALTSENTVQERNMPAYWVARSKINDPVEYKKYTDLVPAIIEKFGGKVLARGGRFQIMEGPHKFHRFIVIEFPTLEQGAACFTSPEYDRAAAFRRSGAGEVETIMVEGI